MKTRLLVALLLLAPASARADLIFKCNSVKPADQLSANLRFEENGRAGSIELDLWSGYPPIGLVYADLKAPQAKGGMIVFPPAADAHSGYTAELAVPGNFLNRDDFRAVINLSKSGQRKIHELNCNRF